MNVLFFYLSDGESNCHNSSRDLARDSQAQMLYAYALDENIIKTGVSSRGVVYCIFHSYYFREIQSF